MNIQRRKVGQYPTHITFQNFFEFIINSEIIFISIQRFLGMSGLILNYYYFPNMNIFRFFDKQETLSIEDSIPYTFPNPIMFRGGCGCEMYDIFAI